MADVNGPFMEDCPDCQGTGRYANLEICQRCQGMGEINI